jgi:hypothetical protein
MTDNESRALAPILEIAMEPEAIDGYGATRLSWLGQDPLAP